MEKTRKYAAREIHECMKGYERELALSYNTIYRSIYKRDGCWHYTPSPRTSHYNYTA